MDEKQSILPSLSECMRIIIDGIKPLKYSYGKAFRNIFVNSMLFSLSPRYILRSDVIVTILSHRCWESLGPSGFEPKIFLTVEERRGQLSNVRDVASRP